MNVIKSPGRESDGDGGAQKSSRGRERGGEGEEASPGRRLVLGIGTRCWFH